MTQQPVTVAFVVGRTMYEDDAAVAARIRQERIALNQGMIRVTGEPERVDTPVQVVRSDDDGSDDWAREPEYVPADDDTANAYRIVLTWQVESAGLIRPVGQPQLVPVQRPSALQDVAPPQDAPTVDPLDQVGETMLHQAMGSDPAAVETIAAPATRELYVVFRGAPGSSSQAFDRIEDAHGRQVRAGAWVDMGEDDRWALRLTTTD